MREKIAENARFIVFGVFVILFLGGIFWLSNQNKIDVSGVKTTNLIEKNEANGGIEDHVIGDKEKSKNAKVTLVEYGDFQCPGCATMSKKVKALAEEYDGKVRVIFRNFPIEFHPNSLSAAAAAEAAGLQGKYIEMHIKLFESQNEWSSASPQERTEIYKKYAREFNLDEAKFVEDMKSSAVSSKIKFDKTVGGIENPKVTGTPSFYLNGEEINSEIWRDDAKLREKINSALK